MRIRLQEVHMRRTRRHRRIAKRIDLGGVSHSSVSLMAEAERHQATIVGKGQRSRRDVAKRAAM